MLVPLDLLCEICYGDPFWWESYSLLFLRACRETSAVCCGVRSDSLMFSILRKYPEIKTGHLFDLPSAVKDVVVPDDLKNRFFPQILFVSLRTLK